MTPQEEVLHGRLPLAARLHQLVETEELLFRQGGERVCGGATRRDRLRWQELHRIARLPVLVAARAGGGQGHRVIAIINAVQVFEPVALITQGGPVGSTNVLTYHIRRVGIERAEGGLGSAMAVTLMLSLIVVICAVFAFVNRKDDE